MPYSTVIRSFFVGNTHSPVRHLHNKRNYRCAKPGKTILHFWRYNMERQLNRVYLLILQDVFFLWFYILDSSSRYDRLFLPLYQGCHAGNSNNVYCFLAWFLKMSSTKKHHMKTQKRLMISTIFATRNKKPQPTTMPIPSVPKEISYIVHKKEHKQRVKL